MFLGDKKPSRRLTKASPLKGISRRRLQSDSIKLSVNKKDTGWEEGGDGAAVIAWRGIEP